MGSQHLWAPDRPPEQWSRAGLWAVVPAYLGFLWTFCYASRSRHPLQDFAPAEDPATALGTRYYAEGVHRGAFALPPFMKVCLPPGTPQNP